MTMTAIREIVDEALGVVGEATGSGVQTYSEDRVMKDAIRAFNMVFKKYNWPQYNDWFTLTLDGTTGRPTTTWGSSVRDIDDILCVYKGTTETRIPMLPKLRNPAAITGTSPLYWKALLASDADFLTKRFHVYPFASTGTISVLARIYPCANTADMNFTDLIDIDKDILVAATAFMTLSSDDLNPGAADAQRNMMEQRYKDIMASVASEPIAVTGTGGPIPDQWYVTR